MFLDMITLQDMSHSLTSLRKDLKNTQSKSIPATAAQSLLDTAIKGSALASIIPYVNSHSEGD